MDNSFKNKFQKKKTLNQQQKLLELYNKFKIYQIPPIKKKFDKNRFKIYK